MSSEIQKEIDHIIHHLQLIPHPEGGFYREVYRSPIRTESHSLATSIYFLLTSDHVSRFHRIQSDELWFHHKGNDLIVHTLSKEEGHQQHMIGSSLTETSVPQHLVKANTIFGSSVSGDTGYALVSCVVAPGFEFSEFELFTAEELLADFPEHAVIIHQLT